MEVLFRYRSIGISTSSLILDEKYRLRRKMDRSVCGSNRWSLFSGKTAHGWETPLIVRDGENDVIWHFIPHGQDENVTRSRQLLMSALGFHLKRNDTDPICSSANAFDGDARISNWQQPRNDSNVSAPSGYSFTNSSQEPAAALMDLDCVKQEIDNDIALPAISLSEVMGQRDNETRMPRPALESWGSVWVEKSTVETVPDNRARRSSKILRNGRVIAETAKSAPSKQRSLVRLENLSLKHISLLKEIIQKKRRGAGRRKHQCGLCGQHISAINLQYSALYHIYMHKHPFSCPYCGFSAAGVTNVPGHMMKQHPDVSGGKNFIDNRWNMDQALMELVRICLGNRETAVPDGMAATAASTARPKLETEPGIAYSSLELMVPLSHDNEGQKTTVSGFSFGSGDAVDSCTLKHVSLRREITSEYQKQYNDVEIVCKLCQYRICDLKTFNCHLRLQYHIYTHQHPFCCPCCKASAASAGQVRTHVRRYHANVSSSAMVIDNRQEMDGELTKLTEKCLLGCLEPTGQDNEEKVQGLELAPKDEIERDLGEGVVEEEGTIIEQSSGNMPEPTEGQNRTGEACSSNDNSG